MIDRKPTSGFHRFLLCILLVFSVLLILFYSFHVSDVLIEPTLQKGDQDIFSPVSSTNKTPIILFWTRFYSHNIWERFAKAASTCPYKCIYTNDTSLESKAKVHLFHARNFNHSRLPRPNPAAWNLFLTLEAPQSTFYNIDERPLAPDFFNWTMTYRSSSDVYLPYGQFVPLDGTEDSNQTWTEKQVQDAVSRKTMPVLIAVSNCYDSAARLKYLDKLSSHINITQVGRCFNKTCDKSCLKELIQTHHFYLAFENAICPEYTTEKFWRLRDLIVPVVLSREVMDPQIPNDTYIAASDFETPKKLADYLKELIKDREKYQSFFSWTRRFRLPISEHDKASTASSGCQLCKLVHEGRPHQIPDYRKAWTSNDCLGYYVHRVLLSGHKNRNQSNSHWIIQWLARIFG